MDEYELSFYEADLLTGSKEMAEYEEEFVRAGEPVGSSKAEMAQVGSNWILGEVSRIINANSIDMMDFR